MRCSGKRERGGRGVVVRGRGERGGKGGGGQRRGLKSVRMKKW